MQESSKRQGEASASPFHPRPRDEEAAHLIHSISVESLIWQGSRSSRTHSTDEGKDAQAGLRAPSVLLDFLKADEIGRHEGKEKQELIITSAGD